MAARKKHEGMSVAAWNALNNRDFGANSQKEVAEAIRSGKLHYKVMRGVGPTCWKEICAWAGVPELENIPKAVRFCPHCGMIVV
jgi:hypothetical protein